MPYRDRTRSRRLEAHQHKRHRRKETIVTENRTRAVLKRVPAPAPRTAENRPQFIDADGQPTKRTDGSDTGRESEPRPHGPRRWNDPDEKLMLWGALFFLGLGLYAAAFVAFGMWLTP